jgi:hypothetical protein
MEKKHIDTFIRKYHLGGLIEKVFWTATDDTLLVTATPEDKKLFASVTFKGFEGFSDGDGVVGIQDTTKLKKMLAVTEEEIKMELIRGSENKDRVTSLLITDKNSEVNYVTADAEIVGKVPKTKDIPNFEVEIEMTPEFIEKFMKAKGALDEAQLFTLATTKKNTMTLILGYNPSINNNRISLSVTPVSGKDKLKTPISFSAKALKEILLANAECDKAVLKVSELGLAKIEFSHDKFDAKYYMIKIEVEG